MYSKTNSSFNEINISLNKVYQYLNSTKTEEQGNELFKKIINKYISQNTLIFSIINSLEEKIMNSSLSDINIYTNLLSLLFEVNSYNNNSLQIYLPYLNPVLSIIQSLITEKNTNFLNKIPEIFTKIIHNLTPDDINASNKLLTNEEKKIYEILQNFCFYNLKFSEKINQVIGSLCLTKLVENCPYVLKNEYMKIIIENIILLLSLEEFKAKHELLNCLISLILGAENIFIPYAKLVFNKIIEFLTNDDWAQRKLALNIIYILIYYCKEEMSSLKENIINILNILKKDKIKEVRDVCLLIEQLFENENKSIQNKRKNISSNKNTINKNKSNKKKENNLISKIGKINYIKYNNISTFSPNSRKKNKISNSIMLKTKQLNSNIPEENNKLPTPKNLSKLNTKRKKPTINHSSSDANIKNNKEQNKRKYYSFINEKMVIKPDPNKSIFNTGKNMAFFNQNRNNSDNKKKNLIIIPNKQDFDVKKNFNTCEGFYKKENSKINIINEIDKDYEKNKDDINKLISLDEKIKSESNKKFDNNSIFSSNVKTKSFHTYKENSDNNSGNKQLSKNANTNDNNLIKALLSEVRELSNKQLSLLDLMDDIQTNTQNEIKELNAKIINLDDTIKDLTEQLYFLQNEQKI